MFVSVAPCWALCPVPPVAQSISSDVGVVLFVKVIFPGVCVSTTTTLSLNLASGNVPAFILLASRKYVLSKPSSVLALSAVPELSLVPPKTSTSMFILPDPSKLALPVTSPLSVIVLAVDKASAVALLLIVLA